ncbi:MAG: hypothetical protein LZF61_06515 [Nitrosomonas sp.]|nr:MAG: hypothetical protein LZF61_06515 [Nitrosomonas sp.]
MRAFSPVAKFTSSRKYTNKSLIDHINQIYSVYHHFLNDSISDQRQQIDKTCFLLGALSQVDMKIAAFFAGLSSPVNGKYRDADNSNISINVESNI